jgi:hypothetical protein
MTWVLRSSLFRTGPAEKKKGSRAVTPIAAATIDINKPRAPFLFLNHTMPETKDKSKVHKLAIRG